MGGLPCSRGVEKGPEKETLLPWGPSELLGWGGRSRARPGAGWKSGAFLLLKIFEGQKNENRNAASALDGSVCFISPE